LLLHLLKAEPHVGQQLDDTWDGSMQALASSGDLLTSLTYAVSHPLAEDLCDLSLQGVESVYGGFLNYLEPEPLVLTVITTLISEGLLATALDKTLLYCQKEGSQTSMKASKLLLTLSLEAPTTDARIRAELSHAVLILRKGWTGQSHDLLVGWLHEALFEFPWIWPTVQRANIIPNETAMAVKEFTSIISFLTQREPTHPLLSESRKIRNMALKAIQNFETIGTLSAWPYWKPPTARWEDIKDMTQLFRELIAMTDREKELTITANTMKQGLHRHGLHEFCSPTPQLIDQSTFIKMACDEIENMKLKSHKPQTTNHTQTIEHQSSPSSEGDDT